MEFVSERIINISELEKHIEEAQIHFVVLMDEIKKATTFSNSMNAAALRLEVALQEASQFDFCLEKRKCIIPDCSLNPTKAENFPDKGSYR